MGIALQGLGCCIAATIDDSFVTACCHLFRNSLFNNILRAVMRDRVLSTETAYARQMVQGQGSSSRGHNESRSVDKQC